MVKKEFELEIQSRKNTFNWYKLLLLVCLLSFDHFTV